MTITGDPMTFEEPPPVIEVYDRHGAAWATLRTREKVGNAWLDRFCGMMPKGATVLDIGCGAGVPIARELKGRGYAVTGIDGSATMVALFKANLPDTPVAQVDMRKLALNVRFAGLLAWDSFFHLSPGDQRPMFDRFATHAVPGAALMFTSGTEEGTATGTLEGMRLYHGSLTTAEYRTSLEKVGFEIVAHVESDPSCGNRTIWLARMSR